MGRLGQFDSLGTAIKRWLHAWATPRRAHFTVGTDEDPYLRRWFILPRNRYVNIYLHQFCRDDEDRALHDHQWWFASFILKGHYSELCKDFPTGARDWSYVKQKSQYLVRRNWFSLAIRPPEHAHRVILPKRDSTDSRPIPCWTICITGPVVREWGFHCPQGWRHWKEFLAEGGYGNDQTNSRTGRGCD